MSRFETTGSHLFILSTRFFHSLSSMKYKVVTLQVNLKYPANKDDGNELIFRKDFRNMNWFLMSGTMCVGTGCSEQYGGFTLKSTHKLREKIGSTHTAIPFRNAWNHSFPTNIVPGSKYDSHELHLFVQRRQQSSPNVCAHSRSHQIETNTGSNPNSLCHSNENSPEKGAEEEEKTKFNNYILPNPVNRAGNRTEYKFSIAHHVTEEKSN